MLHKYGELGEHIENLDFFFKQHFCVWKFAKMKKIKTKGNMLLQNSFFFLNIEKKFHILIMISNWQKNLTSFFYYLDKF
jgi:hypothetical protein